MKQRFLHCPQTLLDPFAVKLEARHRPTHRVEGPMLEQKTWTTLADRDPSLLIRDLGTGYAFSQALYAVATLGIADLVAAGPRTAVELASATNTHAPSLYRVLRLL